MITSLRPVFMLLALFALPLGAQAQENDVDWKVGAWSDLTPYIGTYNFDAVLDDERVAAALTAQLGAETFDTVKDSLQTRNPIGFERDCLLLSGQGAHAALVAVCIYEGTVHTALKTGKSITLYTALEKYEYLPYGVKIWLYDQTHKQIQTVIPEGVTLQLSTQ